jgi:uncharacterized protein YkwD
MLEIQKKFSYTKVIKNIVGVFTGSLVVVMFLGFYLLGIYQGYQLGQMDAQRQFDAFLSEMIERTPKTPTATPTQAAVTPTQSPPNSGQYNWPAVDWGGPQLWDAVNNRRVENGVNRLQSKSELCTIASIRLNELLELGKLDGHEGFSNLKERRPDLADIFDNYSTVAEFLAVGGKTPEETVSLWENTLGHKKLLTGGEYVWGCIYSQNTFAVAITAF